LSNPGMEALAEVVERDARAENCHDLARLDRQ
jgi:hypothetical protein